ncbi:hypothetical protein [Streptomyces sp. YS-3]|uniref:hypothetical protein n=1 Tax=Streptomyces sp. YS-3 TaxID=3381352 RepID=UPI003862469A
MTRITGHLQADTSVPLYGYVTRPGPSPDTGSDNGPDTGAEALRTRSSSGDPEGRQGMPEGTARRGFVAARRHLFDGVDGLICGGPTIVPAGLQRLPVTR